MANIPVWLQVAGLISQMLTGFLTLVVLILSYRYTGKLTRELKRADVLMEVNRKFDALIKDWEELARTGTGNPRYYYERFWSLQLQQFSYWLQGFITDHTFRQWMFARKNDFRVDTTLCCMSFSAGWEIAKQGFQFHSDFVDFIEQIRKSTDVIDAMRKHKHKLQLEQLGR
jgi:hypothetical protein